MSDEVRHPLVVAECSKMPSTIEGVEAGQGKGWRVTNVVEDGSLLQDVTARIVQE
jgi:hypothetical protein